MSSTTWADSVLDNSSNIFGTTTSYADFDETLTVPADTIRAGSDIEVAGRVEFPTVAGATDVDIQVYVGGLLVHEELAFTVANDQAVFVFQVRGLIGQVGNGLTGASLRTLKGDPASALDEVLGLRRGEALIATSTATVKVRLRWNASAADTDEAKQTALVARVVYPSSDGDNADATWDEPRVQHVDAGTMGRELVNRDPQITFEMQPWDEIRAQLYIEEDSTPVTGATVQVEIQRLSDGQWLQNGGGSWTGAVSPQNTLTEVSAAQQPGWYNYSIPLARLTYAQGRQGYRMTITGAGTSVVANRTVFVVANYDAWEEARADHETADTFGEGIGVAASSTEAIADAVWDEPIGDHQASDSAGEAQIGQFAKNERVIYTAWTSKGRPKAGYVLFYDTPENYANDVSPWNLAIHREDFVGVYSGDVLTQFGRSRVS
jgi:hypothetical protein